MVIFILSFSLSYQQSKYVIVHGSEVNRFAIFFIFLLLSSVQSCFLPARASQWQEGMYHENSVIPGLTRARSEALALSRNFEAPWIALMLHYVSRFRGNDKQGGNDRKGVFFKGLNL
jgi:hypothetical protein